jgi:hypothetical protein
MVVVPPSSNVVAAELAGGEGMGCSMTTAVAGRQIETAPNPGARADPVQRLRAGAVRVALTGGTPGITLTRPLAGV